MQDAVIGCISNYNFDQIRPWVVSLEKSGFTGKKMMIILNGKRDLVQELTNRGFQIAFFSTQNMDEWVYTGKDPVVVARFLAMYQLLNTPWAYDVRNVISTDVKDVVFQRDPSHYLASVLTVVPHKSICVGSENLRYNDEEWGAENMAKSFPYLWEDMGNKEIYNAGTIAGRIREFQALCLHIYMTSHAGYANGIHNPDQAALNVLLSHAPWKDITLFNPHYAQWACQAGTTIDPRKINRFRPKFVSDKEPIWNEHEQTIETFNHMPYYLFHQWDRTQYADIIRNKYK